MVNGDGGTLRIARLARMALSLAATLSLAACAGNKAPILAAPPASAAPARVDLARLNSIDKEPGAWLTTGRDAGKTHYSPLDRINRETAPRLGFAWELKTGTNRGMEATPIDVEGVKYASGAAGRGKAVAAATR